jgi:hypothetical protein
MFLGASASTSTSTYCPRQWAVQVRRSALPATSTQRIGPSRTGFRETSAGGGKRRRTALTRRARSPLAPNAKHCSRREQR